MAAKKDSRGLDNNQTHIGVKSDDHEKSKQSGDGWEMCYSENEVRLNNTKKEPKISQQNDKTNVNVNQEVKTASNSSKTKSGKLGAASIWAVTSLGEVFVNQYEIRNFEATQMEDDMFVQEIDLTGGYTPVHVPLRAGCMPGMEFILDGYINQGAERMHVNLDKYSQHQDSKSENVHFHFNPRFDQYEPDVVVRNTMIDGDWGTEERWGKMPFEEGKEFTLKIKCCEEEFKVYVHEELYCTYKHRLPIGDISTVSICGDVRPYKLIIKNPERIVSPKDMFWQQLGGHFKKIESCRAGVTWGINYDNSVWVYNGGWGGSFFGNVNSYHVNPMIDYDEQYMYEYQRWNAVTSTYTSISLLADKDLWNSEVDQEKQQQDLVKLISMDWQWVSNWEVDFNVPGIDSEGWQYCVKSPSNDENDKSDVEYGRSRKWHRRCAINTKGPWEELGDIKLLDIALEPLDESSDSVVKVWAVTADGQAVVRIGVSPSNRMGTAWEYLDADQALISIACGPYDQVWAVGKNGFVYRRTGIDAKNRNGDSWEHVKPSKCIQFRQVAVGQAGVWTVDSFGNLYIRQSVACDTPQGSAWQCVARVVHCRNSTRFKQVSVGHTEVWAVSNKGIAMKRVGISSDNAAGVGWNEIPGNWQHLTVRAL